MKNKYIGGSVLSTQPDKPKRPKCKNAKKNAKQLSNIEFFSLARLTHSAFYKIHISGATNRHTPVKKNMKNMLFFFFFFFFFFF